MSSPDQVLSKFTSPTLLEIADRRGLKLSTTQQRKVLKTLEDDVLRKGVSKVLEVLKVKNLKKLCANPIVDFTQYFEEKEKKN